MKRPATSVILFIFMTLTLFFGTYLTFEVKNLVFYYGAYYTLCFGVLHSFKYGPDFFLTFNRSQISIPDAKVVVVGQNVSSNIQEDKQEDRFLNVFDPKKAVKRKVMTWILFLFGVWFFYFQQRNPFSWNTFIPVLSCFTIVNTFFVGHFLIALLLNALIVSYTYSAQNSLGYFIYAVLVMSSLALIASSRAEVEQQKLKEILSKRQCTVLMILALVYVGSSFGFSYFIPRENQAEEQEQRGWAEMGPVRNFLSEDKGALSLVQEKLAEIKLDEKLVEKKEVLDLKIQEQLKSVSKLEEKLSTEILTDHERENTKMALDTLMRNHESIKRNYESLLNEQINTTSLKDDEKDIFARVVGGPEFEKKQLLESLVAKRMEINELAQQIKNEGQKQELINSLKAMKTESDGFEKRLEEVTKGGSFSDEQRNFLTSYTQRAKDELKDETKQLQELATKMTDEKSITKENMIQTKLEESTKTIENLDQLMNKLGTTAAQENIVREEIKKLVELKDETKKELSTLSAGKEELKSAPRGVEKEQILKPLEVKKEEVTFLERLKKLLPLLVICFLFFLVNYFLRKKGIKRIEVSDPEILDDLKRKWRELRRLKLSPREEVIHYYNLFHECVQKIHYADHEAPPSCVINDDMKDFNPDLGKATHIITEVFALCFYGNKEVPGQALKLYRKALNKILKVYRLS